MSAKPSGLLPSPDCSNAPQRCARIGDESVNGGKIMTEDRSPSGGSDWRAVVIAAAITAVVGAIATVSAALIGHQQGTHDAPPGR
jgi:hypothetical protein